MDITIGFRRTDTMLHSAKRCLVQAKHVQVIMPGDIKKMTAGISSLLLKKKRL